MPRLYADQAYELSALDLKYRQVMIICGCQPLVLSIHLTRLSSSTGLAEYVLFCSPQA